MTSSESAAPASNPPLHIAILNCPGTCRYDPLYKQWIDAVATKLNQKIIWEVYDPADGALPPLPDSSDPDSTGSGGQGSEARYDGYIISGSRHGVYEQEEHPWISELCQWANKAHLLKCKVLGVCFGHQVIAKALGGTVTVNPNGFEIGRHTFTASNEAIRYFERLGMSNAELDGDVAPPGKDWKMDMLYVHGDYLVPEELPAGMFSMGGTDMSPHNGLFNGSNLLTFQGHPEFLPETVDLCIDALTKRDILPSRLPDGFGIDKVRESLSQSVDAKWLGYLTVNFFRDTALGSDL
eukprot:CAMPEP_0197859850 /NCGR_PEP_ID=MMETSP1438-20131217/34785_1 /TAXON_ID=1461541 /ORGANISM="Pterosperma sp., Strain CCMP1384" /LENGTH=294 /DNA_ID=CAMNT_0043476509 /DNA_START=261 /DNA_END=1145 /DNA_ORIENTATION=-